jgi:manganese/iron transport system permease protein
VTGLGAVTELVTSPLLRRALLEVTIVGALNGAVGVHVVLRRLPFFAMTLAHGSFPGLVLASLAGVSLLLGAWVFALVIVAVTALLGTLGRLAHTSAVGVVLSGSFALGALLTSARAGQSRDLAAFLVGSVLTVSPADVVATLVVALAVAAVLAALHKELVLGAFDSAALEAMGYPRAALDAAVLVVVAGVLAVSVPAVGAILSVALLVTPASTARLWVDGVWSTMAVGSGLGALSSAAGLAASHQWDVAAGGAIVLAGAAAFVVSLVASPRAGLLGRRRGRRGLAVSG